MSTPTSSATMSGQHWLESRPLPRIALIHATRLAIDPVENAFAIGWPEAKTVSILDESLSVDLAANTVTREVLNRRINALADYALGLNPAAILYTCSAFGAGIEQAAARLQLPVLKPNEAMFDAALGAGDQVTMLYTFPPAAQEMEREFRDAALLAGSDARLTSILVPDAFDALKAGDTLTHNALVTEAACKVTATDILLLAQFSLTPVAAEVRAATAMPVLTSPETAITKLQQMLGEPVPC